MLRMKTPLLLALVITKTLGELLFIFGLLAWIYGILVQLTHPEWLTIQLSHLTPWIRVDTFTIMCFIVSAVGFFLWRITRELISKDSWRWPCHSYSFLSVFFVLLVCSVWNQVCLCLHWESLELYIWEILLCKKRFLIIKVPFLPCIFIFLVKTTSTSAH